jgi:hypothetical protein
VSALEPLGASPAVPKAKRRASDARLHSAVQRLDDLLDRTSKRRGGRSGIAPQYTEYCTTPQVVSHIGGYWYAGGASWWEYVCSIANYGGNSIYVHYWHDGHGWRAYGAWFTVHTGLFDLGSRIWLDYQTNRFYYP